MKKIVIIPIIAIVVIIIGFSFIPILEQYQLYKWDTKTDELLGEGQKFTDATGKRCLMSETIAGDKCPIGSRGYNPDTGVYDTGVSGMAQLNAKLGGYSDPYDPSSFDRIDAMLGIPQQLQKNIPLNTIDSRPTYAELSIEFLESVENLCSEIHSIKNFGGCNSMDSIFRGLVSNFPPLDSNNRFDAIHCEKVDKTLITFDEFYYEVLPEDTPELPDDEVRKIMTLNFMEQNNVDEQYYDMMFDFIESVDKFGLLWIDAWNDSCPG